MIEINGMEAEDEITWIDTMSEGGRTFTDESGNGRGGGRYDDAMAVVGEDAMIEINGMEEEEEITWIDTMSEGGRMFTDESGNGRGGGGWQTRRGGRYDDAMVVVGEDAMIEINGMGNGGRGSKMQL